MWVNHIIFLLDYWHPKEILLLSHTSCLLSLVCGHLSKEPIVIIDCVASRILNGTASLNKHTKMRFFLDGQY